MNFNLEGDLQQQMIAVAVLDMLERGEKVADIAEITQEIVKQVWYGYTSEQKNPS
jgi:hypothetical protein